jgi:predicted RNA-binding Zn-ribbon protein involved in translation (DUF1610 family)
MSQQHEPKHYVRRVVLPSGKTIEVVYFAEGGDGVGAGAHDRQEEQLELHICPACGSHLVYPTEWQEAGPTHWDVDLRCPNCEWRGSGIFDQETVERFDVELDRGTEELVRDLKRLAQANMEEEVERFVAALHADHILPDDF